VDAHGRPRYTQDRDVLVEPTPANARRVSAAIADFKFKETAREMGSPAVVQELGELGKLMSLNGKSVA